MFYVENAADYEKSYHLLLIFVHRVVVKRVCCVLQALQYLHKLCSHPALVMTPQHPQYGNITASLQRSGSSLRDIHHAPKLVALQYVVTILFLGGTHISIVALTLVV